MLCKQCSSVLREGAKFCSKCGTRVESAQTHAAALQEQKSSQYSPKPDSSDGLVLMQIRGVAFGGYGGTLTVKENALEFKRKVYQGGISPDLGSILVLSAIETVKQTEPFRIPYSEIASITEGKCLLDKEMKIGMKNGKTVIFSRSMTGSNADLQRAADLIKRQLQRYG